MQPLLRSPVADPTTGASCSHCHARLSPTQLPVRHAAIATLACCQPASRCAMQPLPRSPVSAGTPCSHRHSRLFPPVRHEAIVTLACSRRCVMQPSPRSHVTAGASCSHRHANLFPPVRHAAIATRACSRRCVMQPSPRAHVPAGASCSHSRLRQRLLSGRGCTNKPFTGTHETPAVRQFSCAHPQLQGKRRVSLIISFIYRIYKQWQTGTLPIFFKIELFACLTRSVVQQQRLLSQFCIL